MPRDNFFRVPWLNNIVDAAVNAAEDIGNNLNPDRQRGGGTNNTTTSTTNHATTTFTTNVPMPQQQQQQQSTDNQRIPPASARAIRQLPTIRVAPEDLVEPCNRECCICLEE
jgi:hypothetical protein